MNISPLIVPEPWLFVDDCCKDLQYLKSISNKDDKMNERSHQCPTYQPVSILESSIHSGIDKLLVSEASSTKTHKRHLQTIVQKNSLMFVIIITVTPFINMFIVTSITMTSACVTVTLNVKVMLLSK